MEREKFNFKNHLEKKDITISAKIYFIDAMSMMAFGLFASLLIGTIFDTIAKQLNFEWLLEVANFAKSATGAAMGVAIACALKAPPFVLFSATVVGLAGNALGGPVGTLIATIFATEFGKFVSKETKVDLIVTPTVTILVGVGVAQLMGPTVSALMAAFGELIIATTELHPFFMGILVSVIVGMVLTLPISSAALCVMLGLSGLAGGAALAGCCAQMVGFAVASYRENKIGGLISQGIGTSMLQVPNIFRHPIIWLAPTLTAAITGPLSTVVFKLEISSEMAVASGMGTCGLVGPIGVLSTMGSSFQTWTGILVICVIAPAVLSFLFDTLFRKIGWVQFGYQTLDL